ncbi:MAG: AAC(3) family N-acetyltransferase [Planctomycetota bacterium]
MANHGLMNKLLSLSPGIEVGFRHLYWRNVGRLNKSAKKRKRNPVGDRRPNTDFGKCLDHLRNNGVGPGSSLVVHAAYERMGDIGKNPAEVIDALLDVVGNEGTLSMPAMPLFRNSAPVTEYLDEERDKDQVFKYDVQSTRIKTGALAQALLKHPDSLRSRHPINTMVAAGKRANYIVEGNLEGDSPLPCGRQSSWYKCTELDSWVVSLGTDLTHSLTMIHVAEDMLEGDWAIKDWYREKKFLICDGEFTQERTLRERRPKWGALHFAERTLCRDLIKNNIMKSAVIDGVLIEMLSAQRLLSYLNSKNQRGYPYFYA